MIKIFYAKLFSTKQHKKFDFSFFFYVISDVETSNHEVW
jgi:hypothetical protein